MNKRKAKMINLEFEINCIQKLYKEKAYQDWCNGEMTCAVTALFGGNKDDYLKTYYYEDIKKDVNEKIYKFQNDIYNQFLNGFVSQGEYEYCYIESKKMIM